MNGAHLHLIVNHVSLFAIVIGACVLAASMILKSAELRFLATIMFVIAGVFGWIGVESGEGAADVLKALGGDSDPFIKEHAQAATFAQISGIVVAVLAIGMEVAVRKKEKWVKPLQWVLLILAIHGCTVFGRTAFLGGLIRHSEIRSNSIQ